MASTTNSHHDKASLLKRLMIFIVLMILFAVFTSRFMDSSQDVKRVELTLLSERFADNVVAAHWQWQAKGQPRRVVLHEQVINELGDLASVGQRVISINYKGWPQAERTTEGCKSLWRQLLDQPMNFDRFSVFAEYRIKPDSSNEPACLYRLSSNEGFFIIRYAAKLSCKVCN